MDRTSDFGSDDEGSSPSWVAFLNSLAFIVKEFFSF
ncbi:hypothetical protein T190115A13A_220025 [Tenacibaculum sp. 190524A02b]|uniref:Uncharacterized protein n=1 Tax=Tenacibaculum vairaonense TaxID=3137860 RepID=A0ABM9PL94_9FLAO